MPALSEDNSKHADERFRPEERVRTPGEYRRILSEGRQVETRLFFACLQPRPDSPSRLGLIVSRRVGNAVVRNRVKRMLRETFRTHKTLFATPCDMVLRARPAAARAALSDFSDCMKQLAQAQA